MHIAVPRGFRVERTQGPYGHPIVNIVGTSLTAQITYSSGLVRIPETSLGPNGRVIDTATNVTTVFTRLSKRVVLGQVPGAQCEVELVGDDEAQAVALCSSMRVPRPGALTRGRQSVSRPYPPIPEFATLNPSGTTTMMYTGYFSLRVLPNACPNAGELREANGPDFQVAERRLPHGPALVGRSLLHFDGNDRLGGPSVCATRAGACCIASFPDFKEPTEAQLNYVATLCDATQ